MTPRAQAIAIAAAILMLGIVFELVRRRRLRIGYSLIWLLTGLTILTLVLFRQLATLLSTLIGIQVPTSLIFAAGISLSLLILLEHSLTLTVLWRQDKAIAQHQAQLEWQIRELQARLETSENRSPAQRSLPDHDEVATVVAGVPWMRPGAAAPGEGAIPQNGQVAGSEPVGLDSMAGRITPGQERGQ